jgi:hypothetical protein
MGRAFYRCATLAAKSHGKIAHVHMSMGHLRKTHIDCIIQRERERKREKEREREREREREKEREREREREWVR